MAIQTINIGNIANDGTGDDLREAFIKVNNNFTELNNNIQSTDVNGENLGSGQSIFAQKSDNTLQFKTLLAGAGITLSPGGNTVSITANSGVTQIILISDDGSIVVPGGASSVNLFGGQNINTKVESGDFKVDIDGNNLVQQDTAPKLGGNLDANLKDITNVNNLSAVNFNGSLEGNVYGVDVRTLPGVSFDFGAIEAVATNTIDYLIFTTDQDLGTFVTPSATGINLGTITSPS
tara:strand:- start:185 stop:889 length:705 start_codon:yes stop_codon:yes gene_type:complete